MKNKYGLIIVAVMLISGCVGDKPQSSISTSLLNDLKNAKTIMWIAAHPDDELYMGGTLGYATRDLGCELTIVSFNTNSKFFKANQQSAEFLKNADYIRLNALIKCDNMNEIDSKVDEMIEKGIKDKIVQIIIEKKPDIVFTFEPTNGYRTSCAHCVSSIIAREAIEESGVDCDHYYVLNRDPVATKMLGGNMDPLPVTDTIELDEKLWSYRMEIFEIYSPFYPKLKKIISDEDLQDQLSHQEFFKRGE